MTNDELKKKIVEVVLNSEITGIQIRAITGGYSMANNIADALIAAGIGDMSELQKECDSKEEAYNKCYFDFKHWKDKAKEYKHCAARAERAFSKLVHEMYEHGIRPMCDEKFFVESRLKDAEKELAEEGEDDSRGNDEGE